MQPKHPAAALAAPLAIIALLLPLAWFGGCKGSQLYKSSDNFYAKGSLTVQVISLEAGQQAGNPLQMDIYVPQQGDYRYPVVIFQHGFTSSIKIYSTILNHLASHGFVVVAPQMYAPGGGMGGAYPSLEEEAALGLQVVSWVRDNITEVVPVQADARLLGLAGHSRGGQIAYRMAMQKPCQLKALAGVDPVDGLTMFGQTPAITGPLHFHLPTYILGTGLGKVPADPAIGIACAPEEAGYQHFYDANPHPSWLSVATENGHADMINEDVLCPGGVCNTVCTNGTNRDGFRAFVAGTLAAFFSGTLQRQPAALGVLAQPDDAPVACTMEHK